MRNLKTIKGLWLVYSIILLWAFLGFGCEKEVDIDLPDSQNQLVIEGKIENGRPPLVLVSTTQDYFEPTSAETIGESYVSDAQVWVNDSSLTRICASGVPDSLLSLLGQMAGVPVGNLNALNICVYTTLDSSRFGEVGKTYSLKVKARGQSVSASTSIPPPVPPDSTYYSLYADREDRGLMNARYDDPPGATNFYRVGAQRIGTRAGGGIKDPFVLYSTGSVIDDRFSNGTTFRFFFGRGNLGDVTVEPTDDEPYLFENGDTVVVQSAQITRQAYRFYRTFEAQVGSTGSPFASPSNIDSNIEDGRGLWAGYGTHYDTVYCQP